MKRRNFIFSLFVAAGCLAGGGAMAFDLFGKKKEEKKVFPLQMSDAEWQEKLDPEQYRVLRKHGTEPAGSSPLNKEKRNGTYYCAGCEQAVYSSEHKYESGTGWPSFYQPINEDAVGRTTDYVLVYPRTEIHCSNCGGHLGHVFEDGPAPTGFRYCMNGAAMIFKPQE